MDVRWVSEHGNGKNLVLWLEVSYVASEGRWAEVEQGEWVGAQTHG